MPFVLTGNIPNTSSSTKQNAKMWNISDIFTRKSLIVLTEADVEHRFLSGPGGGYVEQNVHI